MIPPLVVAFALAGRVDIDLSKEPIGRGQDGQDVYLKDIWPTQAEIADALKSSMDPETYRRLYSDFTSQNPLWNEISSSTGDVYEWDDSSTYIGEPLFFEICGGGGEPMAEIKGGGFLGFLGVWGTPNHTSPAGSINPPPPAGKSLIKKGVNPADFNSYGSRRGNDRVMTRG